MFPVKRVALCIAKRTLQYEQIPCCRHPSVPRTHLACNVNITVRIPALAVKRIYDSGFNWNECRSSTDLLLPFRIYELKIRLSAFDGPILNFLELVFAATSTFRVAKWILINQDSAELRTSLLGVTLHKLNIFKVLSKVQPLNKRGCW
jgi:hypothetical protein